MATPKNESVRKAFKLLRAFRDADEWLTSAELSRRARLPQASGYRLIQTLEEIGAVLRGPRGRYRPGMLLIHLSRQVEVAELLRDVSHGVLFDLASRLSLTVHMGVFEDGMVTYVAKVGESAGFAVHTRVGAQHEAYCTGLGKVLLASLPYQELEDFIDEGDLVPLTPHTITDPAAFRREIMRVRQRGFAIDDGESALNLRCVAVPVRDSTGKTIAAISVSDEAERMDGQRQDEVRIALQCAAAAIQHKLMPAAESIAA
ncbi:IclR family transcriptional regulator [Sphingosinicella sp. CPCC 101087]|uniref:IclR family transcriptional regulator n=1 Tax=Sphingosinicella sp. CPCC 101087 TaxID=2497754 RepID=UPI00101D6F80|nr:IclR family transcriptional regulator [Sphingosinicella sp. CPCC 101087]